MGLPMFREPAPEVTKPAGKSGDPTAPARSSIRRRRSVRYPAHPHRDRQSARHTQSTQSHFHDGPPANALRARDRVRVLSTRSDAERALNIEIAADQAHAEASRRRRLESGRAILRDALSYEHTHHPTTMLIEDPYLSTLMRPPTPSSASFRHPSLRSRHRPAIPEIGREGSSPQRRAEWTRTPPPMYIPSPPYTYPGHSNGSSPHDSQSLHGAASSIPRFAAAHVLARIDGLEQPRVQHRQPSYDDATASDSMLDDLPPLQRVHRRHTPDQGGSVQGELDGLGDRWRSVSPDTDPWEVLLSTMPPDERLPSTSSSSFRSNEDLASHEGLGDVVAEPMSDGMGLYPVICDNSDSDFTEAGDETMVNITGLTGGSSARSHRRSGEVPSASSHRSARVLRTLGPQSAVRPHRPSTRTQGALNRRLQRHLDEMATLTGEEGISSGRPNRERL
ncbi:MAG: hypothetical protein Q9169_000396 [Polycauliona sp. 2 TL-2023]